jgi:hypothetical protein
MAADKNFMGYEVGVTRTGPLIECAVDFRSETYFDQLRQRLLHFVINTMEEGVRAKLIELGWAPPQGEN